MNKLTTLFTFLLLSSVLAYGQYSSKSQGSNVINTPIHYQLDGVTTIFMDDMNGDNTVAGIEARGWFFDDVDGAGTTTTFQGNETVFPAYEGPANGYLGENYNGAAGGGFLIDQWLISPEVTVQAGDSLKFWHRSPDGSTWPDPLEVWISSTAGTTHNDFDIELDNFNGSTNGWAQYTGLFPNAGTVRFAVRYYTTNGGPSGSESDYVGFDLFEVTEAGGTTVIPISQAIEDLDNDFVPDHLGETVTVQGVVFSPNYQTSNNSFYISDGTAGTDIFSYAPPLFTWNMGDMLEITGEVSQYNGMTEIIPADSTGWVFISSGNPTPDPIVLTLAQYKADPEMYEGSLVGFMSLNLVGGTWPAAGSSANLQLSDGQDTVTFRIDSDTDIDGQPEPTWPADVLGIGSQYDSSVPPDGGYQIFPRYYASDFLPPGTIPVELTSFTAEANLNSVSLNWNTATETNNEGFEIQRNSGSGFATIGYVHGNGTSTQAHSYSFVDQNVAAGQYTYRLKQVDFQGTYSFSSEVSVKVDPVTYSLAQNYPNPFNPTTMINFNLRVDSKVSLKIFNILGQEVAQLVNGTMVSGNHQINFDASKLNSGVYLYRLEAAGIDGSTFTAVKKMMLTK